MNNYTQYQEIQPVYQTQSSLFYYYGIPDQKYQYIWPFNLEIFSPAPLLDITNKLNENSFFQEFKSRVDDIIVLKAAPNKEPVNLTRKLKKNTTVAKFKQLPKICQKQSRNVVSNLLRIFFKVILELDHYGTLIDRVIEKQSLSITRSQFYGWLSSFNINFKNYIRLSQIRRIFSCQNSHVQRYLFHILFSDFIWQYAPSHCLTSKRIDLSSVKMHLQGLRDLRMQLNRQNKSKK